MLSAFISGKYFRNYYLSIRLQSDIIDSIYNGITKFISFGLETPLVYFFLRANAGSTELDKQICVFIFD